jgi:hypothetical protein
LRAHGRWFWVFLAACTGPVDDTSVSDGTDLVVDTDTAQDTDTDVVALEPRLKYVGNAFRVNEAGFGQQHHATLGLSDDGSFLISFVQNFSNGDLVYGASFDSRLNPLREEFPISPFSIGGSHPQVMNHQGGYLVSWDDELDGFIRMEAFGRDGTSTGQVVDVALSSAEVNGTADIAQGPDGQVIVVWWNDINHPGYFMKVFDRELTGSSDSIQLIEFDEDVGSGPAAVDVDEQGRVLLGWSEKTAKDSRVWVSQFDLQGDPIAEPILLAESSSTGLSRPDVAWWNEDRYAVTWRDHVRDNLFEWVGTGAWIQLYDADESLTDPTLLAAAGDRPVLELHEDVMYVAWEEPDIDRSGVMVQAWSLDPSRKLTDAIRINGQQQSWQSRPFMRVITFEGRPVGVITWESEGEDGDAFGVYARRFELVYE